MVVFGKRGSETLFNISFCISLWYIFEQMNIYKYRIARWKGKSRNEPVVYFSHIKLNHDTDCRASIHSPLNKLISTKAKTAMGSKVLTPRKRFWANTQIIQWIWLYYSFVVKNETSLVHVYLMVRLWIGAKLLSNPVIISTMEANTCLQTETS